MSAQIEPINAETSEINPLEAYAAYQFASDETYQQGLASLLVGGALDGNPPADVRGEILRRTRVFYFNRITGHSISMDEAREYERTLTDPIQSVPTSIPPTSEIGTNDETRVLSFAELQELIETGNVDRIPNNRVIPDILNDATPSESTASARKKPWEISATSEPEKESEI